MGEVRCLPPQKDMCDITWEARKGSQELAKAVGRKAAETSVHGPDNPCDICPFNPKNQT